MLHDMIFRLGMIGRRGAVLGLLASFLLVGPLAARSQEPSLRAERTIDYKPGQAVTVNAKVGAVNVQTVEFSERAGAAVGLASHITGSTSSDTMSTVRAHFVAENATANDWEVTFTLEFLDKTGKLIDHVSKKESWKGEAKPMDIDHPLLTYVLPLVAQVRVRLDAKLD